MQDTYKELYRIRNSNNKKEIIDNIDIVLHTQLHNNNNNNILDIQKFYLHLYLKQFSLIIYNIIKKIFIYVLYLYLLLYQLF